MNDFSHVECPACGCMMAQMLLFYLEIDAYLDDWAIPA